MYRGGDWVSPCQKERLESSNQEDSVEIKMSTNQSIKNPNGSTLGAVKLLDIRNNAGWYISITLFSISTLSSLAILITILNVIRYLSPVDANAKVIRLKIVRGMSSQAIADQLVRRKLIRSSWVFLLATHLSGASHRLQVGTYRLSGAMSIPQIIDHLRTGKVIIHQLMVPEGLTVTQIGKLWEKGGFGTAARFQRSREQPKVVEQPQD